MKRQKEQGEQKKKRRHREDGFEEWGGYMNAKITKLEEQYELDNIKNNEKLSNIFQGISIFVNGYTEPSADELRLMMLLHGGVYHHYHRSNKTTHIIASNLPNAKMDQLKTSKVVKPEWITESIAAGKLLDYKNFLLFVKPSVFEVKEKAKLTTGENLKSDDSPSKADKGIAKTAADEKFLSEFYSNSRLHHLSTMGAMFKQYVGELKSAHDGIYPGRSRLSSWKKNRPDAESPEIPADKVIMHIDMDCFFVSVALRSHPELAGQPVAVTHARGNPTRRREGVDRKFEYDFYRRKMEAKIKGKETSSSEGEDEDAREWTKAAHSMSEVASCSYEARQAGVSNGMYLGSALKLCPNLKTVPYDFEGYKEVSFVLYNTVAEYTLDIEAVSCDELFIDCDDLIRDVRIKPLDFATFLRNEIREKTRCPSSVGIGANKLQARLATKRAKPDGQFYLTSDVLLQFMKDVDVYDLPGVGRTLGYKLKSLNVKTCEDLRGIGLDVLKKEFGNKTGETLYRYSRGMDDRSVKSLHQRKSVSAEVNYGIRFRNDEEASTFLKRLSQEVSNRLKEIKMKGKCISFKVMIRAKDAPVETAKFLGHGACDHVTRSVSLPTSSDDPSVIAKHVINIYNQLNVSASDLRGIGIQITKLEGGETKKPAVGTASLQNYFKPKTDAPKTHPPKNGAPLPEKLKLPPPSQLDPQVLNCLPDEIRLEILNEYGLDVLKNCADVMQTASNSGKETKRTWSSLTVQQVRNMIKEWVASVTKPENCDVDMLADYLSGLVGEKRLEEVNVVVKCLNRHIRDVRTNDVIWFNAYRNIIDRVQSSVLRTYGKMLFVQENLI